MQSSLLIKTQRWKNRIKTECFSGWGNMCSEPLSKCLLALWELQAAVYSQPTCKVGNEQPDHWRGRAAKHLPKLSITLSHSRITQQGKKSYCASPGHAGEITSPPACTGTMELISLRTGWFWLSLKKCLAFRVKKLGIIKPCPNLWVFTPMPSSQHSKVVLAFGVWIKQLLLVPSLWVPISSSSSVSQLFTVTTSTSLYFLHALPLWKTGTTDAQSHSLPGPAGSFLPQLLCINLW